MEPSLGVHFFCNTNKIGDIYIIERGSFLNCQSTTPRSLLVLMFANSYFETYEPYLIVLNEMSKLVNDSVSHLK